MVERTKIERREDKIVYEDEKGNVFPLAGDTLVSMNMFGFTPDYFKYSEDFFSAYLKDNIGNPKSEFYIPTMVNKLVADGKAQLRVLHSAAQQVDRRRGLSRQTLGIVPQKRSKRWK